MHKEKILKKYKCLECGGIELRAGGPDHVCNICVFTLPKFSHKMKEVMSGKREAGRAVASAVRDGSLPVLASLSCVDCGDQAKEYDHRNYAKPLDVEPVCRSCNRQRGHALPVAGFISNVLAAGGIPYKRKRLVAPLLERMGIYAPELSGMPPILESEHWLVLSRHFVGGVSHV